MFKIQKINHIFKNYLKNLLSKIPFKYRISKKFFSELALLKEREWYDKNRLEEYQLHELKKLIHHAYSNVPYYKELFLKNKIHPNDIKQLTDLTLIPFLTKKDIRTHFNSLCAKNLKPKDSIILTTSGTTGEPLKILFEKRKDYLNYDPFMWRFFLQTGCDLNERMAALSDWKLDEKQISEFNPIRNRLILSAYNLNSTNAITYFREIQKYKIKFFNGYPSLIELLTKLLIEKKISISEPMRGIITHSEILLDSQRHIIENFWKCKCFNKYGMEERAILGFECKEHRHLHLTSDYSIVEFIPLKNIESSEIVTTSLINYAMPLIRYKTEDTGTPVNEMCKCGRHFPLFQLNGGRKKIFALTKDNSYIPMTNIDIPGATENIKEFQFVQKQKGHLELNLVTKDTFNHSDLTKIRKILNEKFFDTMSIHISYVKNTIKTKNQKSSIFINQIESMNEQN